MAQSKPRPTAVADHPMTPYEQMLLVCLWNNRRRYGISSYTAARCRQDRQRKWWKDALRALMYGEKGE